MKSGVSVKSWVGLRVDGCTGLAAGEGLMIATNYWWFYNANTWHACFMCHGFCWYTLSASDSCVVAFALCSRALTALCRSGRLYLSIIRYSAEAWNELCRVFYILTCLLGLRIKIREILEEEPDFVEVVFKNLEEILTSRSLIAEVLRSQTSSQWQQLQRKTGGNNVVNFGRPTNSDCAHCVRGLLHFWRPTEPSQALLAIDELNVVQVPGRL